MKVQRQMLEREPVRNLKAQKGVHRHYVNEIVSVCGINEMNYTLPNPQALSFISPFFFLEIIKCVLLLCRCKSNNPAESSFSAPLKSNCWKLYMIAEYVSAIKKIAREALYSKLKA